MYSVDYVIVIQNTARQLSFNTCTVFRKPVSRHYRKDVH